MKARNITKLKKKKNQKRTKDIKQQDLITVVLLCDSPGYRMKSYGPVSLITLGNKKLIDIQISTIKKVFKNFEIVICLGFDADKICKYVKSKYKNINIRIVENQLYNSSNSCESLRLSLNNICNNQVIICDGNLLINSLSLSLVNKNESCVLVEKNPCETLEIGLNIDNNIAQHFSFGAKYTWSEIIFLHGQDIIECLRRIVSSYESKTRFIFESINELIDMNYNIKSIYNDYRITKINNIKTYHSIKDTII